LSRFLIILLSIAIYGLPGFIPLVYDPTIMGPSEIARTALIGCVCPVLLAVYVFCLAIRGNRITIKRPFLLMGIAIFLGMQVLSLAWTPDRRQAALWNITVFSMFSWLGLLAACVPQLIRANRILAISVIGGSVAAMIGILQHFGIDVPPFGQTLRPASTFLYSNVGAQYFAMLVPLALIMAVQTRGRYSTIGWLVSFLLMLAYLLFTRCRGAWMGVFLATVTVGVMVILSKELRTSVRQRFSRFKILCLILVLGVVLIGMVLVPLGRAGERRATWAEMWSSFTEPLRALTVVQEQSVTSSSMMRWRMLHCSVGAFKDHWFLGLGSDGFRVGIIPYFDQETASICYAPDNQMINLHCDPIQFLLELGIIGGMGLLIIIICVLYYGWKVIRGSPDDDFRWIGIACMTGLTAVFFHSLVSFPFHISTSSFMAATLAGIIVGLHIGSFPARSQIILEGRTVVLLLASIFIVVASFSVIVNTRLVKAMRHIRNAMLAKFESDGPQAIDEIDKAIALSDLPYVIRREHGYIHSKFNPDKQKAAQAILKSLEGDEYSINNLVNAAGVEIELGQYAFAEMHLERALEINEEQYMAHYGMGLVKSAKRDFDAARDSFGRCLELRPDFGPARNKLIGIGGQESNVSEKK